VAWWIFQNVIMTTALAGVVAMVCRAGRIGPVARHALWVLVLVKFVTPPVVVWPWAAPDPLGIATLDLRPVEAAPETDALPDALLADAVFTTDHGAAVIGAPTAPPTTQAPPSVVDAGALAVPWLLGVWAAGSACLLLIEGVRLVRLRRRITAAGPVDAALVRRVGVLAAQLGIRPVPVVMVAGGTSPIVWGLGRPRLLWPSDLPADSAGACVDGLLVHELAHIKRRDHLVGWIELAAGIVWWWNPLFWWVRSSLREQAELACDAWVISALPNGRRAYAESLLALSGAAFRGPSSSMAAVGIHATSRRVLERRLVMIMKGRSPLRLPFVGLCALGLVASASLPAWATAQQPPPPPTPAQVTPPAAPARQVPPPPQPARRELRTPPTVTRQVPPRPAARTVTREQVAPHVTVARPSTPVHATWIMRGHVPANMPEDGKAILEAFNKEQEAIQLEADRKTAASREAVTKSLQDLQDRYTKDGKLDEAVAIRDYLRAGGPTRASRIAIRKD
jgi:beta-lactamase regulating signal transducer with metallopeptidase domain